jgi:large subunit ribosomal protein L24
MVMLKIKRDDEVVVIAGKDKGKRGKVLKVLEKNRLLVAGVQMVKKHQKPNPQAGVAGGIIEKEAPIQVSNVALFNGATNKGDRVGFKVLEDNKKIRIFKSNGEAVDA